MSDIKYFPRIFIELYWSKVWRLNRIEQNWTEQKRTEQNRREQKRTQLRVIKLNIGDSIKITLEYDVWTKNDISTKRNKNILKINFYKNLIKNMKKSLLGKQVFNESLESLNWIQHRNTVKSAIWNTFGTKKKQFHLVMCFNLSESI